MLDPYAIRRLSGFGGTNPADGFMLPVDNVDDIFGVLDLAKKSGRKVVSRGGGRSYGDAAIAREALVLDLTPMNRVVSFNPESGVIECEAGMTLEDLWHATIESGWWPPVVTGTMHITLGGALAMNVHGKNHWRAGSFAEHVLSYRLVDGALADHHITRDRDEFHEIPGSAGLMGVITHVTLQLKKVESGNLQVGCFRTRTWRETLDSLDNLAQSNDYAVGWVDMFSRPLGRAVLHSGSYVDGGDGLSVEDQDLPPTVFGVPKSLIPKALRWFQNRPMRRLMNAAKWRFSKNNASFRQSLVEFSFLLDYVPGWESMYGNHGFIQVQPFVPFLTAEEVFEALTRIQQVHKCESTLAVVKRHRADSSLWGYALDGFSLAMDFSATNQAIEMAEEMQEVVVQGGGQFYWAKDSTLSPGQFEIMWSEEKRTQFQAAKGRWDHDHLFTSDLAERVGLIEPRYP
jgi:decaprenylphospho-beta-D-ribofuranose 2-oxidase